ncbi:MAG TPA: peptidylprolyl isomerase [Steroidobacter sp.]|jgi:peptidyl-prolyl cis-trans isomerase C|nr:peptidylprolyl isomerase [Steroidobacteraceae bacterium]HLS80605.1 peptidylprolyl isomerase [Steroidobacter sp.]
MTRFRHCRSALLLAPLLTLTACGKTGAPDAAERADAVATVNGEAVTRSEFDLYLDNISQQSGRDVPEEQKSLLLDQYISMRLAAEQAEKNGVTKDPAVADQIALARMNVILDAGLQKYLAEHPVSDEELKPEYDAQVAAMPREYHARHILVDDKATADAVNKQLREGADFAELAKQKSKDSSKESGGDLGWFTLDSMVKPFADAVAALEPGQTTAEPVQSQFGWHLIRLEESRMSTPAAFDEVKDRIRVHLQRKRLQTYLEELRKGAKIEKKI